ncbi:Exosome non-catalytic core component, variant 2 [Xanthoria calcicola]
MAVAGTSFGACMLRSALNPPLMAPHTLKWATPRSSVQSLDLPRGGKPEAVVAPVEMPMQWCRWKLASLVSVASIEREGQGGTSERISEMQLTIANAFSNTLITHLYPHSTILITLHVLSQDGSLLAACLNASTLALIDAGVPMSDYIAACTSGSTSSYNSNDEAADPLLDLNGTEELELPFLTVGTLGAGEKVSVLVMESRVQAMRLEGMLAVGVDGCKQVKEILDDVVRRHGKRILLERVKI